MGIRRIPALISVIPAALVLFGCSGGTSDPADLVPPIEYLDERTVAVELRDDFAFHDGEPLTVEDVKFTFDFAKEVNSPHLFPPISAVSLRIISRRWAPGPSYSTTGAPTRSSP